MIKVHLKKILKDMDMSISELSRLSGVSQKVLGTFQNQKTESIHYPTVEKITSVLGISVGELITNEENIYELKVELDQKKISRHSSKSQISNLIFRDILNKEYIIGIDFTIDETDKNFREINILVNKLELGYFPQEIKSLLSQRKTNPFSDTLYKILSYILVQEIMHSSSYSDLNITDSINVDFSSIIPKFFCIDISNDILKHQNQTDIIVFPKRKFEVFLIPRDPNTTISEHKPDLKMKYLPYTDSLITSPYIYDVVVDHESFNRKVFMYFK